MNVSKRLETLERKTPVNAPKIIYICGVEVASRPFRGYGARYLDQEIEVVGTDEHEAMDEIDSWARAQKHFDIIKFVTISPL